MYSNMIALAFIFTLILQPAAAFFSTAPTCIRKAAALLSLHASESPQEDRRGFLKDTAAAVSTASCVAAAAASFAAPAEAAMKQKPGEERRRSPRPYLYRIDYTDPPTMVPYLDNQEGKAVAVMAAQQLVFVGEHPDSDADHVLAADLLNRLHARKGKKLLLGLEQVQQRFQPALDAYVAAPANSAEAEAALRADTEWDIRWIHSFDSYLPLLRLAKSKGLRVVALGVDSESLAKVAARGLEGLSTDERNQYVIDLKG
jgi:Haem-binding uptake, Tiki superfamily, ChaN